MQGVVKVFDPLTGEGIVMTDVDRSDVVLAADALEGSIFRILRQGQRVVFDVNGEGLATTIRIGSEVDMGTPGFAPRTP